MDSRNQTEWRLVVAAACAVVLALLSVVAFAAPVNAVLNSSVDARFFDGEPDRDGNTGDSAVSSDAQPTKAPLHQRVS